MLTRWYRTGVIYSVDVGLFQDGNDDGIGDFQGLVGRLDYLARLGISTIWLHPIHPSPRRDGGYDITDHYGVHPRYGSLGDFSRLIHEAGERGIRLMLDLVVNHTSDQHPWFRSARRCRNSPSWPRSRPGLPGSWRIMTTHGSPPATPPSRGAGNAARGWQPC